MKISLTPYAMAAAAGLAATLQMAAVHAADAGQAEQTASIMGVPAQAHSFERPTSSLKSRSLTGDESPVDDSEITERVTAAIAADPRIKGTIDVSTVDGVVRLVGNVRSVGMIYRVIEITEGVNGVRGVDENRLVDGYSKPG